jgi:hypothetical protein
MGRVTKKSLANRTSDNTYRKSDNTWATLASGTNQTYASADSVLAGLTNYVDINTTIREIRTFTIE